MTEIAWAKRAEEFLNSHTRIVGAVVVICGFVWRLLYASDFYLNPDEALHYTVACHEWHGWAGFYQNATSVVHPPLFIPVLRGMLRLGSSEWILRLVPMVAGALFPWFLMLWLQRFAGNAAALCAQLLLTFSPTLIELSTEVRAYTLAFLFLSISLVLLEEALARNSARYMAGFQAFLYLAILTEYCVAWFVAALGIYAILRLWLNPGAPGRAVWTTWILGQSGALALYILLYFTQVSRWSYAGLQGMYSTWLQGAFPQPHEQLFVFALRGTFRQFKYALDVTWLAGIGVIAFVFGLYSLWRKGSHWQAILLVLPFGIACLGAIFHLFPYGATRHTAILSIAIAAGVGVAIDSVFHSRMLPILLAALPLILIWNYVAPDSFVPVARDRHHVSAMRKAAGFLRGQIPAQSIVVTDADTSLILGYYLGCPDYEYSDSNEPYRMHRCGDLWMVVAPVMQFGGLADLDEALSQTHRKYQPEKPLWVAAGGFGSDIAVANSVSNARPFGKAIAIFPVSQSPEQTGSIH